MSRFRLVLVAFAVFASLPLAAAEPVDTTELQALLSGPEVEVVPVEEVPIEAILETLAEEQAPRPAAGDCWISNTRWVYDGCCINTTKYRLQNYQCCCCYAPAPSVRCSWLSTSTTKCEGPCRM